MSVQPRRAYQSDSATATVRLSGVGFGYAATHRTLQDVNLILPAGSFHFLTGPSGAGKSTLLKLLTLAEHPLTGTLHLFGEDATMTKPFLLSKNLMSFSLKSLLAFCKLSSTVLFSSIKGHTV